MLGRFATVSNAIARNQIRMHNEDVLDLYRRVPLGSEVYVLQ